MNLFLLSKETVDVFPTSINTNIELLKNIIDWLKRNKALNRNKEVIIGEFYTIENEGTVIHTTSSYKEKRNDK